MSAALLDKATGGFFVIMLIRSYRDIKTMDVNFEMEPRKRFPCCFALRRDGVSNRFPLSQTDDHRPLLHLVSRFRRTSKANFRRVQKILLCAEISFAFQTYVHMPLILLFELRSNIGCLHSNKFLVFGLADFTLWCDADVFPLLHLFRKRKIFKMVKTSEH